MERSVLCSRHLVDSSPRFGGLLLTSTSLNARRMTNRNASGKLVVSFLCQCLLPNCGDPQFWQRHRENRRVYDHMQHWHKFARKDVDEATDDVINGLFKNGKEPGKEPVKLKPLAPVGDGKPQAVLMRTIPRGSERQRKMQSLRSHAGEIWMIRC